MRPLQLPTERRERGRAGSEREPEREKGLQKALIGGGLGKNVWALRQPPLGPHYKSGPLIKHTGHILEEQKKNRRFDSADIPSK